MGEEEEGESGEEGDRKNSTILLIYKTPELGQVSCQNSGGKISFFSTYPHGGTLTLLGGKPVG